MMYVEVRIQLWVIATMAFAVILGGALVMRWWWVRRQNVYHELVNELVRVAAKADEKSMNAAEFSNSQALQHVSVGIQFATMEVRHRLLGGPKPRLYGWGE